MGHYDEQREKYLNDFGDLGAYESGVNQDRVDQLILDLRYIADHRPNVLECIIKSVIK